MSAPKTTAPRAIAMLLPLSQIVEVAGFNPREDYGIGSGQFAELKESIASSGVLQAPLVRQTTAEGGTYSIVDGHRRIKAARELGIEELLCTVLSYAPEADNLPLSLVIDLHRKDLDPIERAKGFKRLQDRGLSLHDIGKVLGVSFAYVQRQLQLLQLPATAQRAVSEKKLSQQGAVTIARAKLPARQATALAQEAVKKNMTAYEVREKVQEAKGAPLPELRQPTEVYLALPVRYKPLLDWALVRYGSLGAALEALRAESPAPRPTAPVSASLPANCLMGAWSEARTIASQAGERWEKYLLGVNQMSGGVIAMESGPLPRGFVLACEVTPQGVYIAATAQGRAKMLGEAIKDKFQGTKGSAK